MLVINFFGKHQRSCLRDVVPQDMWCSFETVVSSLVVPRSIVVSLNRDLRVIIVNKPSLASNSITMFIILDNGTLIRIRL